MRIAARGPARALLRGLLIAALLAPAGAPAPAVGGDAWSAAGARRDPARAAAGADRARRRRAPRPSQPRVSASPPPRFEVLVEPQGRAAGSRVLVTIRVTGAQGIGRHAAFRVGADPAFLRLEGHRPTGRGALLVEEARPGEIAVYRSSLPQGFAPVEELVTLEFMGLSAGLTSIVLEDVRLMDRRARDLAFTREAGSLVLE